jgi:hypothetical protein
MHHPRPGSLTIRGGELGMARLTGVKPPFAIIKTYPVRGPLQQYRLERSYTFHCFRCAGSKTSKLIGTYSGDWERAICNGCYGRLLSFFNIKAGQGTDDERSEAMARELLQLADEDVARAALRWERARQEAATTLSALALRLLGTSEFVAQRLGESPQLDWSAAVLGLCKAFETELIMRVMKPIREAAREGDLRGDLADAELSRIARYCARDDVAPPELGTMARFFETVIRSRSRAGTSPLLQGFRKVVARQRDGAWILATDGLASATHEIATRFRNPAVHTADLGAPDYRQCRQMLSAMRAFSGSLWLGRLRVPATLRPLTHDPSSPHPERCPGINQCHDHGR